MNQRSVRNISLKKYSQVATDLGIDQLRMFRQVGLEFSWLQASEIRVPETNFAHLLQTTSSAADNASIGLLMGALWKLSDFGYLSLALQHQASLGQAIATISEYSHLLSSTISVNVVRQNKVAIIQLHLTTGREQPGRHPVELGVAVLQALCRHQLGRNWCPMSTHFTHEAPISTVQHRRIFGSDMVFDSDFDGLVLSCTDLDQIHPAYDESMEQYARHFLDTMAPVRARPDIEQQVKLAIQALLPHGRYSIAQVASTIGFSTRSLQRNLESSGTSFQLALNAVRMQTATRALKNPRLSISDVALQTGFAENSSFTRWFNAEFQQSPSNWRAVNFASVAVN